MLERKFRQWIGMLIEELKDLPNADDPNAKPSAEEMTKLFSPPKKISEMEVRQEKKAKGW